jgi:hypothetical protein
MCEGIDSSSGRQNSVCEVVAVAVSRSRASAEQRDLEIWLSQTQGCLSTVPRTLHITLTVEHRVTGESSDTAYFSLCLGKILCRIK